VDDWTEEIVRATPVQFNEEHRYLPESVTRLPGPIRYDLNPFMREILNNFDVDDPTRETNLMKGVQITYTTVLESGMFYGMGQVKTIPIMYMTADKELAKARVDNNIIPMLNQSGFGHIIRSSDENNKRKTGKTANHIQFIGGGYMVPFGARNADKMRSYSIAWMLKDEIDAWPETVGKDGDPDALSDDRCAGYWEVRKIFRGSTPLIKGSSKIYKQYMRGDQRKYMVPCLECGHLQHLRWSGTNKETGDKFGIVWEMVDGVLDPDSVRYVCEACGHAHQEADKDRMFDPEHGAHWQPTAKPVAPGIRSYHLPALYSPAGMQSWAKCVLQYLDAWDINANRVRDVGKYQAFYNNILAEPFEVRGSKVQFVQVSAHRRQSYHLGEVPNRWAAEHAGSRVLFLTCTVDVHKRFLRVAVIGWCKDARNFVIEYIRLDDNTDAEDGCYRKESPVWGALRELIEETTWRGDDGAEYRVAITFVDAGDHPDTVVGFCSDYDKNVYPILGRDRAAKSQKVEEFGEWKTRAGTLGYRILVDHYKDRLAPVLRREWSEEYGEQSEYHFNAPVDILDTDLKELTVERRREKTDSAGRVSYEWYRPGNARNELWDCLVYAHAAVDVLAWNICVQAMDMETIDWPAFWQWCEESTPFFKLTG
jgi:phage terminase large subunit GpA-like protein